MKNKILLRILFLFAVVGFNSVYAGYAYIEFTNLGTKPDTYSVNPIDSSFTCIYGTDGDIVVPPGSKQKWTISYDSMYNCSVFASDLKIYISKQGEGPQDASFRWYKDVGKDPILDSFYDPYSILKYTAGTGQTIGVLFN
ncbi:MAG: hypothetical protein K2P99_02665 [Burkholderiales bacterium]|nr:hypothetical protein [Burkholderiales bacterium]